MIGLNIRLLLTLFLLILLGGCGFCLSTKVVNSGFADLTGRDPIQNSISLYGSWRFYPMLYTPQTLPEQQAGIDILIPGNWDEIQKSSFGVGTLYLKIKLPVTTEPLALKIRDVASAYRLWVNGNEVIQIGKPGINRSNSRAMLHHRVIPLPHSQQELELIMQVSNFHLARAGGVRQPVQIGSLKLMEERHFAMQLLDIAIATGLVLLGLFFFIRYLIVKVKASRCEAESLWIAIVSLLWGVYTLFWGVSGHLIAEIFPGINWELFSKLDLTIYYLVLPMTTALIMTLFNQKEAYRIKWLWIIIGVVFTLPVWLFNASLHTRTIPFYELIVIVQIVYLLLFVSKHLKYQEQGVLPVVLGTIILILTGVNDLLFDMGVLHSASIVTFGILTLVLSQAYMVLVHSANAYQKIETLSSELEQKKEALQHIEEREIKQNERQVIVDGINRALELWEMETGKNRAEFARQSALWKVYTSKDGWDRTQTLDRYLRLDTLPERPRIKTVLKSIDYVLNHCPGESEQHNNLRRIQKQLY